MKEIDMRNSIAKLIPSNWRHAARDDTAVAIGPLSDSASIDFVAATFATSDCGSSCASDPDIIVRRREQPRNALFLCASVAMRRRSMANSTEYQY